MNTKALLCALTLLLGACVGVDVVEDPITGLTITSTQVNSALVGETVAFEAHFINSFGDSLAGSITWQSSNPAVASIAPSGQLSAITPGQTEVTAMGEGYTSDPFLFSVVDDTATVATITISAPSNTVNPGETLQLTAQAFTVGGSVKTNVDFAWSSSNETVATVDQTGLVTALTDGVVEIVASANGVNSVKFMLAIGNVSSRTGQLMGLNGYTFSGDVSVALTNTGNLEIRFADNVSGQSGPGLYVYLANSTTNPRDNGVEVARLTSTTGPATYLVPSNVGLFDYDYVIIHCKPFNVPFGSAELSQ